MFLMISESNVKVQYQFTLLVYFFAN